MDSLQLYQKQPLWILFFQKLLSGTIRYEVVPYKSIHQSTYPINPVLRKTIFSCSSGVTRIKISYRCVENFTINAIYIRNIQIQRYIILLSVIKAQRNNTSICRYTMWKNTEFSNQIFISWIFCVVSSYSIAWISNSRQFFWG